MKVINFGSNYQIYPDDLRTFDALPAHTYKVNFNPQTGFSLSKSNDFEQKEEKVYGSHFQKIDKIFRAYGATQRSLGIILSGDKGIGKSLFTQLLAKRAIEEGLPVILIQDAFPGIANFIESIEQEALILFDEFEKVFNNEDGAENQEKLLGLFDGTSQTKRIYAITINRIRGLNEYMLNRPGRFHYHLRFDYPDSNEINEYLLDKLTMEYHSEIINVIDFSKKVKLNYDCLRAIAFELNMGETFSESIKDLNIVNFDGNDYTLVINLSSNGKQLSSITKEHMTFDLFGGQSSFSIYPDAHPFGMDIHFDSSSIESTNKGLYLSGDSLHVEFDWYNTDNEYDVKIDSILITPQKSEVIHYDV